MTTKIDNKLLKKGINKTTINNAQYATNNTIKNKEKELLKPLVKDNELLNILIQEENMKKISKRLIHTITYEGNPFTDTTIKTKLATSTKGLTTITQTINEINNLIEKHGNEIGSKKKLNYELEQKGHYLNMENKEGGYIQNITITTKIIQT